MIGDYKMKKLLLILLLPISIFSQDSLGWTAADYALASTSTMGQNSLEWTAVDYTLASTFIIGQALDFGLTNHAISNYGMKEANPIFGKNPNMTHIALSKVAVSATILIMVKHLSTSTSQRRWVLAVFNVITWVPVVMNINTLQKSGYSVSLKFSL